MLGDTVTIYSVSFLAFLVWQLTEVQEKLEPLRTLIEEKKVTGKAADYIHTKFQLNLK